MTTTSTLSGAASSALQTPAWAPRPKPTSGSDPTSASFQPTGQDSTSSSANSTDLGALLSQLTSGGQAGATSVNAQSVAQAQSALLTIQEQNQGGSGASGPHAHHGRHGHHKPPQSAASTDPSTAASGSITGATTASGATSDTAADPPDASTQLSTWLSQQASAKTV